MSLWGLTALHDLLILGFLLTLLGCAYTSAPSTERSAAISGSSMAIFTLLAGAAIGRLWTGLPGWLRTAVYRAAAVLSLAQSYLVLKPLLVAFTSRAYDAPLLALDHRLFGFTPALWLERFTTPGVVEYFAFFYFSYFPLTFLMVLFVFARPVVNAEGTRFGIGTALVMGLGQLGYLVVPAFGPVKYMAADFAAPLEGGYFWSLVLGIVDSAGAQRDVFPSLHTAMPTWFALYAWSEVTRLRRVRDPRASWWTLAALTITVFALHIIVSTMLLRWHYAIDVVAGLSLAAFAALVCDPLSRFDARRREALGVPPAFATGRLTSR